MGAPLQAVVPLLGVLVLIMLAALAALGFRLRATPSPATAGQG